MTEGLRSIRPLKAESLRGVEAAEVGRVKPKFEWVDPTTLFVEEGYQRVIAESGIAMIRKIYSRFSWARFKPPICVRLPDSGNVLICIDGQHTATAAATHPDIKTIPVMVVSADDARARASSFVGHNRDRLALTAPMIYRAELAAGDPLATTVDRACKTAGVTVLPTSISLNRSTEVGATIAVGALKSIVKASGEDGLVRVLRVMVAAKRGPIKAGELSAAALVLQGLPDDALDDRLAAVIASKTAEQWAAIAAAAVAESRVSATDATASAWLRELHVRAKARPDKREARSVKPAAESVKPAPRPAPSAPPRSASSAKPVTPSAGDRPPGIDLPDGGRPNVPPVSASDFPKPSPEIKQAPAPPPPAAVPPPIRRNGITLWPDGTLEHRGERVRLHRDDGTQLVTLLLRVMPSILGPDRVVPKVFGLNVSDAKARLSRLIEDIAPVLRAARLEIKTVQNIGNTLFDLGPQ